MRHRASVEVRVPVPTDLQHPPWGMIEKILQWDQQHRKAQAAPLLTNLGVACLRRLLEKRSTEPLIRVEPVLPTWDSDTLQLWLGSKLVRQFSHHRSLQTAILDRFQFHGWKRNTINNPLRFESCESETEARCQLTETVKNLSRGLAKHTIQFRVEHGCRIRWFFAAPDAKTSYSQVVPRTERHAVKHNGN